MVIDGRSDVLYIDRTGAGKSETYFIIAKLMRQRNEKAGPVIIVTPMIALMHDQVRRGKAFGLKAEAFYSKKKGMTDLMSSNVRANLSLNLFRKCLISDYITCMRCCLPCQVLSNLRQNKLDLLYVTAEMLTEISKDTRMFTTDDKRDVTYTPKLLDAAPALKLHPPNLSRTWDHVPLLVIDEIHYIAEAGHDFRLDYARVWSELAEHPWYQKARKLGLTATVNQRVRASMQQALPTLKDWHVVLGSLYRENIALRVQPRPVNDAARVDYVYQLYNQDRVRLPSIILLLCCCLLDRHFR